MLVSFGQNCLHLTFWPYWSSETYSHQYNYVKLTNIVIHACKNITEKMNLLKWCGLQLRLCLYSFRPIALKQFNNLTTIETVSWLGGAHVTLEVPGSITGSGKGFCVWFCGCCCIFTLLLKTHFFVTTFYNSFCSVDSCSILNILWYNLWPIIRVHKCIKIQT